MSDLTDQLDAIQARAERAELDGSPMVERLRTRKSQADVPFLLELARKQQAAIDGLLYVADNKAADNAIGRWWAGIIKGTIRQHMEPKP